jgi:hypothetical protein
LCAAALLCQAFVITACARPERAILEEFFSHSRQRDLTSLQHFSTITFKPEEQGIVTDFDIVKVVEEGETKTVTVSADVKRPDGQVVPETLLVMMERRPAVSDGGATSTPARREWMITGLLEKPRE